MVLMRTGNCYGPCEDRKLFWEDFSHCGVLKIRM